MRQIQCPRCGYTYSAADRSANACPNCGQPTLPPDSATPTITTPTIATDSAFFVTPPPPGASQQPVQPGVTPGPDSPPGQAPRNDHRRRLLTIVAALLAAVALIAIVGALAASAGSKKAIATATATTRATARPTSPSLPAGYTLYTDESGLYAIGYPHDWSITPVNDARFSISEFAQPNLGATMEIERVSLLGTPLSAATAQPLFTRVFQGFAQTLASGNVAGSQSGVSQVKLAGNTWLEEGGDITYTVGGEQMSTHVVVDIISHHGQAVLVARIASVGGDYSALNTQYFAPMLETFRFLK